MNFETLVSLVSWPAFRALVEHLETHTMFLILTFIRPTSTVSPSEASQWPSLDIDEGSQRPAHFRESDSSNGVFHPSPRSCFYRDHLSGRVHVVLVPAAAGWICFVVNIFQHLRGTNTKKVKLP